MVRFHHPSVERLEDRTTPSIYGTPWPNPQGLTLSFVRDGTLSASNLNQTLNSIAPTSQWELEILRAFQTWAVNANINIGVAPDGGQPLGVAGAVQGDPRFGDIRIAGAPGVFASGDLADATPFSWTGSTWSGDVILNTADPFAIGNQPGQYDLFSVMLHEAGHVFGFADSTDPGSAMTSSYANAWVTMTVVDESGNVVLSLSVQADQPTVTANLYLKKGTHAVRFGGHTTDGSAWNDLNYQLSGGAFSDPVGSYPTSPNGSPSSPPLSSSPNNGPPPSTYTYNGSSSPPPPSSSQSSGAPMPYPSSSPYYY